ncbi:MAG: hypothetical protein MUE69_18625 [Myxococcota bacterium]|jgi:hypothetical protein|nr:hypothetical protein [Myxococcota bacterium]
MTQPTTKPTETSVLFALRELAELEDARIAREAAEARAKEEAAAAEARARAEREAAERARREAERAREEAIAREVASAEVDRVVADRTAEERARVEALRRELDGIRAEREELHRRVIAGTPSEPTSAPSRPWAVAFGISVAASAVLGALLVWRASVPTPVATAPEVIVREVRVEVPVERIVEVPAAPPVEAPAAVTPPRGTRPRGTKQVSAMRDRHEDALARMERCGDDPICLGE